MYHLPQELQGLIYEFDNTYREQFKKVLIEIEEQIEPFFGQEYIKSLKDFYDDEDIMPSPPTNFVQVDPDDILDFLFPHSYVS